MLCLLLIPHSHWLDLQSIKPCMFLVGFHCDHPNSSWIWQRVFHLLWINFDLKSIYLYKLIDIINFYKNYGTPHYSESAFTIIKGIVSWSLMLFIRPLKIQRSRCIELNGLDSNIQILWFWNSFLNVYRRPVLFVQLHWHSSQSGNFWRRRGRESSWRSHHCAHRTE